MKTKTSIITGLTMAALCLSSVAQQTRTPGTGADQNRDRTPATDPNRTPQGTQARPQPGATARDQYQPGATTRPQIQTSTQMGSGRVTEINKATSLIGMQVKNSQGESLGTIRDVVIDFDSGRVGYVALAPATTTTTTTPGLAGAQLIAVPLTAFTAGQDQRSLMLQIDRQQLQSAKTFSAQEWPRVNITQDPIHMSFWQRLGVRDPAGAQIQQQREQQQRQQQQQYQQQQPGSQPPGLQRQQQEGSLPPGLQRQQEGVQPSPRATERRSADQDQADEQRRQEEQRRRDRESQRNTPSPTPR